MLFLREAGRLAINSILVCAGSVSAPPAAVFQMIVRAVWPNGVRTAAVLAKTNAIATRRVVVIEGAVCLNSPVRSSLLRKSCNL